MQTSDLTRFILRLGEALHRSGTPADELEDALGRLCKRFAISAHVLITPTSLTACFGGGPSGHMHLIRCNQGEVDLGRLSKLHRLVDSVTHGRTSVQEATQDIDVILEAAPDWGRGVTMASYALCSGAVAELLGGGIKECLAALGTGLVMGLMGLGVGHHPRFGRIFELLAPFASAWTAFCLTYLLGPYSVRMATLAGLIILVPGMAMTTALTELATGHLVAGTARFMGALATFMKLGFGVALGTKAAQLMLHPGTDVLVQHGVWAQWPALGVAALALAVVLKAEPRDTVWIVLCAVAGFLGLRLGAHLLGSELAPCCAAFSVTCFSNLYARKLARTASVTQVPAMLLLVPGALGYRSVAALMQNDVLGGMQAAFTAGLSAMALVAGALLAGCLLSPHKDV